jgi:hypothetical protein
VGDTVNVRDAASLRGALTIQNTPNYTTLNREAGRTPLYLWGEAEGRLSSRPSASARV